MMEERASAAREDRSGPYYRVLRGPDRTPHLIEFALIGFAMKIDLFEFARQHETTSGVAPLAGMPRIDTPDRSGGLAWSATGSTRGRQGAPRLDLDISGDVVLVCQRCLQPMTETLDLHPRFLVASDEATADRLDQDDDFDVVVGSPQFDLAALVEDEVILALPSAPRHVVCPDGKGDGPVVTGRPSPFAALAALKRPPTDSGH